MNNFLAIQPTASWAYYVYITHNMVSILTGHCCSSPKTGEFLKDTMIPLYFTTNLESWGGLKRTYPMIEGYHAMFISISAVY